MRDATWRPSSHKFRLQSTPRLWTVAQRVQGIPGLLGISGREGDLICVSASSSSSSCSSWDEPSPSSSISSNRATLVTRDCFVFFSLIFFFFFFFFFFSSFSSDLSCFDFLDFRLAFEVSDCYRKKKGTTITLKNFLWINLIHDTRHLCTRFSIDGIKTMSHGISGVWGGGGRECKQVTKYSTSHRGRVCLFPESETTS